MAPDKTADAIKLNLRLPKPLHKRLKQQARRNNVSLNTEIVNQLEGRQSGAIEGILQRWADERGITIVIGNPPYLSAKK
jgi:HicB-like protein involved in pilus formation